MQRPIVSIIVSIVLEPHMLSGALPAAGQNGGE